MAHTYDRGKHKLPSVTTIIGDCTDKSGALTQWAANQTVEWIRTYVEQDKYNCYQVRDEDLNTARVNFRSVSKDALDVGSEVHAAIEVYLDAFIKQEIVMDKFFLDMTGQAANAFGAFLSWADEHDLQPIATEQTVYGENWAGTLDLICLLEGKKYIIDFKTSKSIYADEYGPQIAAYSSVCKPFDGCGILRLDKETGEPEFKDFTDRYDFYLNVFNKMVDLYFARHPRIAKKAGVK